MINKTLITYAPPINQAVERSRIYSSGDDDRAASQNAIAPKRVAVAKGSCDTRYLHGEQHGQNSDVVTGCEVAFQAAERCRNREWQRENQQQEYSRRPPRSACKARRRRPVAHPCWPETPREIAAAHDADHPDSGGRIKCSKLY